MSARQVVFTPSQLLEFVSLDENLKSIFMETVECWPESEDLVVTCIHRSYAEDDAIGGSGIHAVGPPYRAIDVRIGNLDADPTQAQVKAEEVASTLNNRWAYDPGRLNLMVAVAKPHGTGPHLHLQVHPNTARRT